MMIKRPLCPLFSAIFVFATAAVLVTFCLRIVVSGTEKDRFAISDIRGTKKQPTVFNATLLAFAAVNLADDSWRQDVDQLVSGDFLKAKTIRFDIGTRSVRSLEFHQLWLEFRQYLQDWWRQRRFDPDAMSNTVNVFKTSIPDGRKYKTCAVVGNSGILLETSLGDAIDSHEFVIRLNNARIGGFERFVGSKTNLSFMNSNILHLCSRKEGCFCHPYGSTVPIMMYISQLVHFLDYTVCNSSHQAPLLITDPQLDVLCARIVKYYSLKRFLKETGKPLEAWSSSYGGPEFHYSSGMQAIMIALGVCDKVSIFGFGKSESAKHHYHTNQKSELGIHDYQAEYNLYEDLVKNPKAIPFISDKFTFPPVVIHR